jgi:hypothetical protein
VIDWTWTRKPNGRYQLTYLKYIEETNDTISTVKEWTETTITTSVADSRSKKIMERYEDVNGLGRIPAVQVYSTRSPVRGIGASDITDIADQQRAIFNEYSEIEQQIRLQNHPALVKTPDTEAGAGAGAIIVMQDNLDPGLKPYLLEPSGNGLEKIYSSIDARIRAIDKMANTGGVRNTSSTIASGIALQTEFQLLNAKLSEKADQLELAEEQIWQLFAEYMGTVWSGEIDYPGSFNIRDTANEIDQLVKAKSAATDPVVFRKIDTHILEWMGEEAEYLPFIDPNPQPGRLYPDGTSIPDSLPAAYKVASDPSVPQGQNCANCEYYKPGELYCYKFDAPVKSDWWCAVWEIKKID